jgi:hypothetical protein
VVECRFYLLLFARSLASACFHTFSSTPVPPAPQLRTAISRERLQLSSKFLQIPNPGVRKQGTAPSNHESNRFEKSQEIHPPGQQNANISRTAGPNAKIVES